MKTRSHLRNIAIIAHVDHGKTTLVDAMFLQGGLYRSNQQPVDRVMDSDDQERERGITILAKATSVVFGDYTLQIVDTPGHADFGGEVERTLRMVDGVLLLVDAAEGPLPQTRFVLRKAMDLNLPVALAINKIDRQDARAEEVLNEVYDLFIDLGANDEQLEFPVMYTVARDGLATPDLAVPGTDLKPLIDMLVKHVPAPPDTSENPFVMQVNQLSYDGFVGRLVIGRVNEGTVKINDSILINGENGAKKGKVTGLFRFEGIKRIDLKVAKCGDIIALAGINDVTIGDTLSASDTPITLPRISVDAPTVSMVFQVNDGPMAGRSGGKFVTSRQLKERLEREAYANVSIEVEQGEAPDQFKVFGRGELQLAVLIENLRRELFEFCVRTPQVVTQVTDGVTMEPMERLVIDLPSEYMGAATEIVGSRKGTLMDQQQQGSRTKLEYTIPTRGLFGMRSQMLTASRGCAIMMSTFEGWIPWSGPIKKRGVGALVSDRTGNTTPYALFALQPRGTLMIGTGTDVYEGMIIGENSRQNDLNVNAVRPKKQTNVRASGKDEATTVSPHRQMSLEDCLEWIKDDEMVEVTPEAIRLRKRVLAANKRSVRAEV